MKRLLLLIFSAMLAFMPLSLADDGDSHAISITVKDMIQDGDDWQQGGTVTFNETWNLEGSSMYFTFINVPEAAGVERTGASINGLSVGTTSEVTLIHSQYADADHIDVVFYYKKLVTVTPEPTATPEETPKPDPTPSPKPSASPSPEPSDEPSESPSPDPSPSESPTPEPTVSDEQSSSPSPIVTDKPTPEPTASEEPSVSPTAVITDAPTPSPVPEPEVTDEPTSPPVPSPSETQVPTVEVTETPAITREPAPEITPTTEPTLEPILIYDDDEDLIITEVIETIFPVGETPTPSPVPTKKPKKASASPKATPTLMPTQTPEIIEENYGIAPMIHILYTDENGTAITEEFILMEYGEPMAFILRTTAGDILLRLFGDVKISCACTTSQEPGLEFGSYDGFTVALSPLGYVVCGLQIEGSCQVFFDPSIDKIADLLSDWT